MPRTDITSLETKTAQLKRENISGGAYDQLKRQRSVGSKAKRHDIFHLPEEGHDDDNEPSDKASTAAAASMTDGESHQRENPSRVRLNGYVGVLARVWVLPLPALQCAGRPNPRANRCYFNIFAACVDIDMRWRYRYLEIGTPVEVILRNTRTSKLLSRKFVAFGGEAERVHVFEYNISPPKDAGQKDGRQQRRRRFLSGSSKQKSPAITKTADKGATTMDATHGTPVAEGGASDPAGAGDGEDVGHELESTVFGVTCEHDNADEHPDPDDSDAHHDDPHHEENPFTASAGLVCSSHGPAQSPSRARPRGAGVAPAPLVFVPSALASPAEGNEDEHEDDSNVADHPDDPAVYDVFNEEKKAEEKMEADAEMQEPSASVAESFGHSFVALSIAKRIGQQWRQRVSISVSHRVSESPPR